MVNTNKTKRKITGKRTRLKSGLRYSTSKCPSENNKLKGGL